MGKIKEIYTPEQINRNTSTTFYFKANSVDGGVSWLKNSISKKSPNSNVVVVNPYGLGDKITELDYSSSLINDGHVSFQAGSGGGPYALKAASGYLKNYSGKVKPSVSVMLADPSISDCFLDQYNFDVCSQDDIKTLKENDANVIISCGGWSRDALLKSSVVNRLVQGGVNVLFVDPNISGHDESMSKIYADGMLNLTSGTDKLENVDSYVGIYKLGCGSNGEMLFQNVDINDYFLNDNHEENISITKFDSDYFIEKADTIKNSNLITSNSVIVNNIIFPIRQLINESNILNTIPVFSCTSTTKVPTCLVSMISYYLESVLNLLDKINQETENICLLADTIDDWDEKLKNKGEELLDNNPSITEEINDGNVPIHSVDDISPVEEPVIEPAEEAPIQPAGGISKVDKVPIHSVEEEVPQEEPVIEPVEEVPQEEGQPINNQSQILKDVAYVTGGIASIGIKNKIIRNSNKDKNKENNKKTSKKR